MREKLSISVCFLTSRSMYEGIQRASEKRDLKLSQLLRQVIRDFLRSEIESERRLQNE